MKLITEHDHIGAGVSAAICLSGDTIQCTPRKGFVSYMYSYPVYIPLPAYTVEDIRSVPSPPVFSTATAHHWLRLTT